MNVGNIGTAYYTWTNRANNAKSQGNNSFKNTIENQGASKNMVLHGLMGEKDEEGRTVVGAWGNAITDTSATVYKPADFDENDPVYLVKVWDAEGNVTEKEVHLNEVDPASSDSFEMYAYTCYLSKSGKCPNAMQNFMMSHAHYQGKEGFGARAYEDMFSQVNWFDVIKSLMDMQYRANNLNGYLKYKGFYDFLIDEK